VRVNRYPAFCCVLLLIRSAFADVIVTEETNLTADIFPADGRIALNLKGKIWLLPATGGQAQRLTDGPLPARQPRWSPDGKNILYQVRSAETASLWLLDLSTSTPSRIGDDRFFDQDASWHPEGERIVYSSERDDTGLDLWETDLPTGLSWRISSHVGDETEPVWSNNGRHLAYVKKDSNGYTLVLRRHGEPEIDLLVSDQPLSSPAWRPDGSLLTILRQAGELKSLDIVILSSPPLIRQYAAGEDFVASPVSWRNRQQMLYTAGGQIKIRGFGDRRGRQLHFRAMVAEPATRPATVVRRRELEIVDASNARLVIRGARLFDGIWNRYRPGMDVLIENGRIASVEPRRDWPEATILDLGNVTVLPGYIDTWSAVPRGPVEQSGPRLLSFGVTTIVTTDAVNAGNAWDGEQTPGPRVLSASDIELAATANEDRPPYFIKVPAAAEDNAALRDAVIAWQLQGVPVLAESWNTGLAIGADLLAGGNALAELPGTGGFQGLRAANRNQPPILLSGLADAGTPGIAELLNSRQARQFGVVELPGRRFSAGPRLASTSAAVVLGSKLNGLPPGLATHAELRALAAAGLRGEQVLLATGHRAATLLGLDNQIGRITPGAAADLVLVRGDPLANAADALAIVAVVRNGRFFSLISLLERAGSVANVE